MAKKKQTKKALAPGKPRRDIQEVVAEKKHAVANQRRLLETLVENATASRAELLKQMMDPRRDLNEECGYPETSEISVRNYRDLYEREAYATRVVELLPEESWLINPTIIEDEDIEVTTPFEESWQELSALLGTTSWQKGGEGSTVWGYLKRADTLSGIGTYGVMLLGLGDGKKLDEPVDGFENGEPAKPAKDNDLLFIRVLDESLLQIDALETREESPRFGRPTAYGITLDDPSNDSLSSSTTIAPNAQGATRVHWSRVIHLADDLGSSELYATPRQRPVLNNLLNIRKLLGSSAEMYYKGAFPGLAIESHPQLGGDVQFDAEELETAIEKYQNSLQRYLVAAGFKVNSLAPQVVDPSPQLQVQIEALCVKIGCPKRIFLGSERGELASSQDQQLWNKRIRGRQRKYLTPRVIAPFIDRLILLGVLPEPTEGYSVVWSDLDTLSEEEQASVAQKRTEAMVKYVQGSGESLVPPLDYLVSFLGMPVEEAEALLERVEPPEVLEDDTEDIEGGGRFGG